MRSGSARLADSGRARQSGRHHHRRGGRRPDDRCAGERRLRSAGVLPALFVDPGEWQLTPDCPPAGGVFLHWRKVTPFALRRADQFRSDPPPALTGTGTRGTTKRSRRSVAATARASRKTARTWRGYTPRRRRGSLEPDRQHSSPPLAAPSVRECPDARAAQHGLERRRRRRDGHEVSLQFLAAGDRDCRRCRTMGTTAPTGSSFVPFIPLRRVSPAIRRATRARATPLAKCSSASSAGRGHPSWCPRSESGRRPQVHQTQGHHV